MSRQRTGHHPLPAQTPGFIPGARGGMDAMTAMDVELEPPTYPVSEVDSTEIREQPGYRASQRTATMRLPRWRSSSKSLPLIARTSSRPGNGASRSCRCAGVAAPAYLCAALYIGNGAVGASIQPCNSNCGRALPSMELDGHRVRISPVALISTGSGMFRGRHAAAGRSSWALGTRGTVDAVGPQSNGIDNRHLRSPLTVGARREKPAAPVRGHL
jgi:hypothetical protein